MGTLLCRLFVLVQQQEPFRSPLWERLISRKLQRKPATAKCGLEKSARTVQTIHTSVPLRATRKAYRSTCSSILVFAGPLAISNIRTRLKPSHKDAPASRALRATFAKPPWRYDATSAPRMSRVNAQTPAVCFLLAVFLLAHQSKDRVAAVPAFAEADIDSLSGPERPARKIEWVYRASPETIGESWGI